MDLLHLLINLKRDKDQRLLPLLLLKIALYSLYRYLFLANTKRKKISFCTTVMNRHAQISQTLPENLETNKAFEKEIEFVLIQFINSREGVKTDKWVRSNFRHEIESGYLKYFITDKMQFFDVSKAKNTAHLNASGLYLFNLDADNYIAPEEVSLLLKKYLFGSVTHFWSGVHKDGSYGRIGLGAYEFSKLGGYNEAMKVFCYEDTDLLIRCRLQLGAILHNKPPVKKPMQNSYTERLANTEWKDLATDEKSAQNVIEELKEKHRKLSADNIRKSLLIKLEKPGVDVIEITAGNIDKFFYSFPEPVAQNDSGKI